MTIPNHLLDGLTRRRFMASAAAAAAMAPAASAWVSRSAHAAGRAELRVGVIGCGGRGTGAAANSLEASDQTRIVALADVFPERVAAARGSLASLGDRGSVPESACYSGFDAYRRLLAGGVDIAILATPPHFRPTHLAAAVAAGCHVFMEKPVATDPAGVRTVLAAAQEADRRGLSIVAGTQRRHEACYRDAVARLRDGGIGRVVAARCSWNQGGLWVVPREPAWSDMEWHLRNWLYFTWLSGDHIVEQHVHNLDVVNWVMGSPPVRAIGLGGRQARTGAEYGHIFDHFAVEYEYPGNVLCSSQCRQIDGTDGRVDEWFLGTEGACSTMPGMAEIRGERSWRWGGDAMNPYVQEHADLIASINGGPRLNEAVAVAESTLTAIMGRMSCYTGRAVSWSDAMGATLDLSPPAYEFGPLPVPSVSIPGRSRPA